MPTARERWFAEVLHAGLETRILNEQNILDHATPSVLTTALPRDVMVKVIEATLASGSMSHKAIVDVVTVELLAEKVPANTVWACIASASERGGIRDGIPKDEENAREFVRRVLASGLETGVVSAKDIVQHVNASVLVASMPEGLMIKLVEVSLSAGKMNPELIVDTIGLDAIASHVSTKTVWAAFVKPGEASTETSPQPLGTQASQVSQISGQVAGKKPRLVMNDDDISGVLVELDNDSLFDEPKPVTKPAVAEEKKPTMPPKQPVRPIS